MQIETTLRASKLLVECKFGVNLRASERNESLFLEAYWPRVHFVGNVDCTWGILCERVAVTGGWVIYIAPFVDENEFLS